MNAVIRALHHQPDGCQLLDGFQHAGAVLVGMVFVLPASRRQHDLEALHRSADAQHTGSSTPRQPSGQEIASVLTNWMSAGDRFGLVSSVLGRPLGRS